MIDKDTLARKLAALTSEDVFDGKALRLGQSGTPDSLSRMLEAIDDTMLERDAVFAVGDSFATLRISGKRVQTLVAASSDLDAPAELFLAPLAADKPKLTLSLCDVLKNLTSLHGVLTVERQRAADTEKQLGSGIGLQALSAALKAGDVADDTDPMDQFFEQISPLAVTLIAFKNSDIEAVTGETDAICDLQQILDVHWAPFDRTYRTSLGEDHAANMRMTDQWGPEGLSTLICEIGDRQCFALVQTQDTVHFVAAWQSAFS